MSSLPESVSDLSSQSSNRSHVVLTIACLIQIGLFSYAFLQDKSSLQSNFLFKDSFKLEASIPHSSPHSSNYQGKQPPPVPYKLDSPHPYETKHGLFWKQKPINRFGPSILLEKGGVVPHMNRKTKILCA